MTEIRLLDKNEIPWAVNTANQVYEACVRGCAKPEEVSQYYNYVRPEYFWQETSAGRLFLWGAFEDGQMCGVCAMQSVGHITMLYVRPDSWHSGIGTRLLNEMLQYAAVVLRMGQVTVNVTPVTVASFFYRRNFELIQGIGRNKPFVSLRCRLMPWSAPPGEGGMQPPTGAFGVPQPGEPGMYQPTGASGMQPQSSPGDVYPTKRIGTKTVMLLAVLLFLIAFCVIGTVTIRHMVKDGLYSAEDWNETDELPGDFGDIEEL